MQNPCEIVLMWTNINLDIYQHVSDLPPYLYDTCHNSSQYQLQFLEIGRDFFARLNVLDLFSFNCSNTLCILSCSSTNLEAQSSKLWWSLWRSSPFNPCPMSNPQFQIHQLTRSSPSLCNLLEPSNINLDLTPLCLPQKTFSSWMEFTINLELFSVQM